MPIVAAVDRSERAESVVGQARELADAYDVALHVVHVGEADVSRLPEGANTGTLDETHGFDELDRSSLPQEEIRQARLRAAETAVELAERYDDASAETVGRVGDPATQVLEYCREVDAEYVVVSTRKRSPVGKVLFGSVTQSLLLNADRPVVTVGDESA